MVKKKNIHTWRRIVQVLALSFIIIIPILNKLNVHFITGTYFSYTFWGLHIVDPTMVIQQLLLKNGLLFKAYLGAGIIAAFALITGRAFCSWICPYFFLMDILNKIRLQKSVLINTNPTRFQFWGIPFTLALIVFISSIPLMTYLSFPGILSGFIADVILEGIFGAGIIIVILVAAIEFFLKKRFWCKYVCPVGATLSLFRTKVSLKISFNSDKCNCIGRYSPCNNVCPLQLNPKSDNLYPTCNNCGECIGTCNHYGNALQFQLCTSTSGEKNKKLKREEDVYER